MVPDIPATERWSKTTRRLAKRLQLSLARPDDLTWTRRRHGQTFRYFASDGAPLRSRTALERLKSLAMPPAYEDVRYAADPKAHLQAIGRDAAARLQYRYHSDWEKVREMRKARRLARLVGVLPKIRRKVAQVLAGREPTREFAIATVVELVARTAIRPGSDTYTKMHGSRGATTLLKSNVAIEDGCVVLAFRAKGGKQVRKECTARKLVHAIKLLRDLPGRRLFQYRDEAGALRRVAASQVNQFLRDVSGLQISLKDFRTLLASAAVLETLAHVTPAESAAKRRRQVLDAVREAAEELSNTPAICRRSYVHETVVTAFERGKLGKFSATLKSCRSPAAREKLLSQILATAEV
ncbi:MAG: DNA topoisomerase IB [Pseudorhodoplanes sp.]